MQELHGSGYVGISIQIHGNEVHEYEHNGHRYVWCRHGTPYQIMVQNGTVGRIEVVLTVDGLSVMNGLSGSFDTRGYIVPARAGKVAIPGFRLTDEQVAQFVFNTAQSSYAEKMGKPKNIGVIGAAFFPEAAPPIFHDFSPIGGDTLKGGGFRSMGPSAGTEFGQTVSHQVGRTSFVRANQLPDVILEIRYETRERLQEMGVRLDVKPPVAIASGPSAFPASASGCPPPPGWRP